MATHLTSVVAVLQRDTGRRLYESACDAGVSAESVTAESVTADGPKSALLVVVLGRSKQRVQQLAFGSRTDV